MGALDGVTCTAPQGAMYVFPQVRLPPPAIAAAKAAGKAPDMFYSLALLDEVGICVVPGSSFGQADGTYHFRTTILPAESQMADMRKKFVDFHMKFLAKFSSDARL